MPNISPYVAYQWEGIKNLITHVLFDIFVLFGDNVRSAGAIVLSAAGFSSITLTNVELQWSRTLSINITLKLWFHWFRIEPNFTHIPDIEPENICWLQWQSHYLLL
jgi:hypothetical protein